MRCPVCGEELETAAEFVEATTEDGVTTVYRVADLVCTNENCQSGRLGLPVRRIRRPMRPKARFPGAGISCCGAPLVYCSAGSYWIPDGVKHTHPRGGKLTVVCAQCGRSYLVDVTGQTRVRGLGR